MKYRVGCLKTRPGFEGGQTPLYRRLPKLVGKPTGPGHTHTLYNLVHLEALNTMSEGATVDYAALYEAKAVTKSKVKEEGEGLGEDEATIQIL